MQGSTNSASSNPSIRVLSWNAPGTSNKAKAEGVAGFIKGNNVDLAFIQEAAAGLGELRKAMGDGYHVTEYREIAPAEEYSRPDSGKLEGRMGTYAVIAKESRVSVVEDSEQQSYPSENLRRPIRMLVDVLDERGTPVARPRFFTVHAAQGGGSGGGNSYSGMHATDGNQFFAKSFTDNGVQVLARSILLGDLNLGAAMAKTIYSPPEHLKLGDNHLEVLNTKLAPARRDGSPPEKWSHIINDTSAYKVTVLAPNDIQEKDLLTRVVKSDHAPILADVEVLSTEHGLTRADSDLAGRIYSFSHLPTGNINVKNDRVTGRPTPVASIKRKEPEKSEEVEVGKGKEKVKDVEEEEPEPEVALRPFKRGRTGEKEDA